MSFSFLSFPFSGPSKVSPFICSLTRLFSLSQSLSLSFFLCLSISLSLSLSFSLFLCWSPSTNFCYMRKPTCIVWSLACLIAKPCPTSNTVLIPSRGRNTFLCKGQKSWASQNILRAGRYTGTIWSHGTRYI